MYDVVVALVVLTHFVFVGYVVAGGFVALRFPRTFGLHVAAVLWAVISTAGHVACPLTALERWARRRAGMAPLDSEGFIAHYLTGVLYPAGWVTAVQVLVFLTVVVAWLCHWSRGRRRNAQSSGAGHPIRSSGGL